jgi:hypothetical protein
MKIDELIVIGKIAKRVMDVELVASCGRPRGGRFSSSFDPLQYLSDVGLLLQHANPRFFSCRDLGAGLFRVEIDIAGTLGAAEGFQARAFTLAIAGALNIDVDGLTDGAQTAVNVGSISESEPEKILELSAPEKPQEEPDPRKIEEIVVKLAEQIKGWTRVREFDEELFRDAYLERPRSRFRPDESFADAFDLLWDAAPQYFACRKGPNLYQAEVHIGGHVGTATASSRALALTLAIADALTLAENDPPFDSARNGSQLLEILNVQPKSLSDHVGRDSNTPLDSEGCGAETPSPQLS